MINTLCASETIIHCMCVTPHRVLLSEMRGKQKRERSEQPKKYLNVPSAMNTVSLIPF